MFDPRLAGKKVPDAPFRLRIWRRDDGGAFRRIHAGDGPAHSPALDAWLVPIYDNLFLRIANDHDATDFWLTGEEAERREKEALAAENAALRAQIAALKGG